MSDDEGAAKDRWACAFMPGLEQLLARRHIAALDLQRPKPKVPDIDLSKDGRLVQALNLDPAMARITWADSSPGSYVPGGYTLSRKELNAQVVPRECELDYTPPAGTKLDAGTHTLTARPKDPKRYGAVEAKVTFIVERAEAFITIAPVPIGYAPGVVLTAEHFQASVQPAGLPLALQPDPGKTLNAGSHPLTATLANDPANANYVCKAPPREDLVVNRAKAALQLAVPAPVRYVEGGYLLDKADFPVTCDPPGLDLVYTPLLGAPSDVGDVTLGVALATTGHTANYECAAPPPVTLTVDKGIATVTLTKPADVEWVPGGFGLTEAQFGAAVHPDGLKLTYHPDIGTALPSGPQNLSVSLTDARYVLDTVPDPVLLQVNRAKATIAWPKPPTPVTFQPGGFALTRTELCATVAPVGLKLAFEIEGLQVKPGEKLQAGTHSIAATLAADPANEHYVADIEPTADLLVNKIAFAIIASKAAAKVDATDGVYALAIEDLGLTTKPKLDLAVLMTDPAVGSNLEPGNKLHSIMVSVSDPKNYDATPQAATIRVAPSKVAKKGLVVDKPAKRVINAVEYPRNGTRATIENLTSDGKIKKQLGNRLNDLEKFQLRAEDHGYDLKPGVWYHCKFLDMTCGVLFTYREEGDNSITPILLDVAFSRRAGNKYAGTYVANWW